MLMNVKKIITLFFVLFVSLHTSSLDSSQKKTKNFDSLEKIVFCLWGDESMKVFKETLNQLSDSKSQ